MIKDKLSSEIIQKIEDVILAIGKDAGIKAFDHIALDRVEWVANAIYQRVRRAKDEVIEKIFDPENEDCVLDDTSRQELLDNMALRQDDPTREKRLWSEATKDEAITKARVKSAREKEVERDLNLKKLQEAIRNGNRLSDFIRLFHR